MTFDQIIGRNIHKLREKFNLTQQDLADRVNIQRVSVSQYETGERKVPTKDLEKIASWFNVELDDLFEKDIENFNFNTAFAFRSDGFSSEDYKSLANFKDIFQDYCRMKILTKRHVTADN